jgi:hypothetical protein
MPWPGHFIPGKETRYLFYRRLGESQGQSGWVHKISFPLGFNRLAHSRCLIIYCTTSGMRVKQENGHVFSTYSEFESPEFLE